jgi:hypothetical protein
MSRVKNTKKHECCYVKTNTDIRLFTNFKIPDNVEHILKSKLLFYNERFDLSYFYTIKKYGCQDITIKELSILLNVDQQNIVFSDTSSNVDPYRLVQRSNSAPKTCSMNIPCI